MFYLAYSLVKLGKANTTAVDTTWLCIKNRCEGCNVFFGSCQTGEEFLQSLRKRILSLAKLDKRQSFCNNICEILTTRNVTSIEVIGKKRRSVMATSRQGVAQEVFPHPPPPPATFLCYKLRFRCMLTLKWTRNLGKIDNRFSQLAEFLLNWYKMDALL